MVAALGCARPLSAATIEDALRIVGRAGALLREIVELARRFKIAPADSEAFARRRPE